MKKLISALVILAASAVPAFASHLHHGASNARHGSYIVTRHVTVVTHVRHLHRVPKQRVYITEPRFAYEAVPQVDYVPRRRSYVTLPYVYDRDCRAERYWLNGHFIEKTTCY